MQVSSELRDCQTLEVKTNDELFNGEYIYYGLMLERYLIFIYSSTKCAIFDYYGTNHFITDFSEIRTCLHSSANDKLLDISTTEWTVTRTRTNAEYYINITLSCMISQALATAEAMNANENNFDFGFTENSFITLVIICAIILIALFCVIFVCWWKKSNLELKKISSDV